jgi:hypothetical protein
MDQHDVNPDPAESVSEVKDVAENMSETKDLNAIQRIIGVFFSPGDTFAQVDRKPNWLVPLLLLTVATFAFVYLTLSISLPEQLAMQQEKMEEAGAPSAQIDKTMEMMEKFGKIGGLVGAVVGPCIGILIASLWLWFVGNVLLSGQAPYMKVVSMYTYASMISVLDMIVKLPLILMKGSSQIQLNGTVFLSEDQSQTLMYHVLQSLDVFAIWRYAILAIGFAAIYKFSLKKAGWTMAVLFLLSMGIAVTWKQLFGL